MSKVLLTAAAVSLLVTAALAGGKSVKLQGHVIDNACAGAHKSAANFAETVRAHPVSCALMPDCAKSGYAVLSDGKLYKLDEAGNKEVARLLAATKSEKGLAVIVEGTLEGETLSAKSVSEAPATK
jgi:hypothetical protein